MLKIIFTSIVLICLLSSCTKSPEDEFAEYCQSFVDNLDSLQSKADIFHDSLMDRQDCDVDFNEYFKYFDKLSIDSNWIVEYHFIYLRMAGGPGFYVFNSNDSLSMKTRKLAYKILDTVGKYLFDSYYDEDLRKYKLSLTDSPPFHIEQDSIGYFQYAVYDLVGSNFCLVWHSHYADLDIICTKERLNNFVNEEERYKEFTPEQQEAALKIDPSPRVVFYNDSVTVRLITFNDWKGFIENKYTISRHYPHEIISYEREILVKYHCGIVM